MKKITMIICIMSLIVPLQNFADGGGYHTHQCAVTKRFYANAWIKKAGQSKLKAKDKGCGFAYAVRSITNCITSESYRSYGGGYGNIFYGSNCGNEWTGGQDLDYQIPLFSATPIIQDDAINSFVNFKDNGITFNDNERSVSIKDYQTSLSVSSRDMANDYSAVVIRIFQFDGEERLEGGDDLPLPKTIYWEAKAIIYNGKLIVEGGFLASDFRQIETDGGVTYEMQSSNFNVQLPSEVDIENVVVFIGFDTGNLGIGIPVDYAIDFSSPEAQAAMQSAITSSDVLFNVSPNPVINNITVNFQISKSEKVSILLLDKNGNQIKELFADGVAANAVLTESFDVSFLNSNDIYFVGLRTSETTWLRKIIKK